MTQCRLVGLYKCPVVTPIGIGNIMRRLVDKNLLIVMDKEVNRSCGTDHFCS